MQVLESIPGSGRNNRLTKKDMLAYLKNNQPGIVVQEIKETPVLKEKQVENTQPKQNIVSK